MAESEQSATGPEPLAPVDSPARSRRQLIGALLVAYGAAEGALLGMLFLVGLQGANDEMSLLLPFLFMLSIPCCLVVVGLALVRDRRWAHRTAMLLPVAIVPFAIWWMMHPGSRHDRLWQEFLGPLGAGAVFALGTVALSAVLLFTPRPTGHGWPNAASRRATKQGG